jgi:Glu-tRNA(Gln) amidotransferase subunit E-like FAD-binding protein
LAREGIVPVLVWLIQRAGEDAADATGRVDAALEALGFTPVNRDDLLGIVTDQVKTFDVSEMRKPEATHLYLMGVLMQKLVGRAEGGRVAQHLEAELKSASGV